MPDRGDGMHEEHARPGISHHNADALLHGRGIAVILAKVAAHLIGHTPASFSAKGCIGVQLPAFGTYLFPALGNLGPVTPPMVFSAVQRDHLGDRLYLPIALFRYSRRITVFNWHLL